MDAIFLKPLWSMVWFSEISYKKKTFLSTPYLIFTFIILFLILDVKNNFSMMPRAGQWPLHRQSLSTEAEPKTYRSYINNKILFY